MSAASEGPDRAVRAVPPGLASTATSNRGGVTRRGSLDVTVTDQFCGAGGGSKGAEAAGARQIVRPDATSLNSSG